ncbi:hypothetical protein [Streptomyces odonnellii]|uniref:hypothetical protein n=1 Tax=Streptomyces odonnellii TaxID=1417980 RepID=UPI0012FEC637|nr:hypothetical protein [Streptomyces odonnellii]
MRHEEKPIRERFPQFGEISGTSWVSDVLNDGGSGVPAPSDVRLTGVASLSAAALAELSDAYAWKKAQPAFSVPKNLSPEVPKDAGWLSSAEFDAAVTGGEYTGTFYLSTDRGIVLFDAVNPVRRTP